jgi:hypothetical protein
MAANPPACRHGSAADEDWVPGINGTAALDQALQAVAGDSDSSVLGNKSHQQWRIFR